MHRILDPKQLNPSQKPTPRRATHLVRRFIRSIARPFTRRIARRAAPITTFLRAAPWPCMTGLASLIFAVLLWRLGAGLRAEGLVLHGHMLHFPTFGWAALALICWLDAISRHRDFQRIKALLARFGFRARIFTRVSTSRCQRDAALHAARVSGHHAAAKAHFSSLGYRWYHLLPDPVMDNPFHFFNLAFLRRAFLPGKGAAASDR